jgi:CHASE1-domain containing sensor protein
MLKSSLPIKAWTAWALLGAGLLITVFVSLQIKQNIEEEVVRQFAFNCDQLVLKIKQRLVAHKQVLRGGASFFAGSESVTRQQWRTYVKTLRAVQNIPGVLGIGFAQVISPDQRDAHIAGIRREGGQNGFTG